MKPNLFEIATKELTQDAFFTWLIKWADPACRNMDEDLHNLGKAFIRLLIDDHLNFDDENLIKVDAGRQWENIDVWAELYFSDNKNIFLIMEDKVFAEIHSDQLDRYKKTAERFCEEKNFTLSCAFLKTGSEPLRELNRIKAKGFKIITRKDVLSIFNDSPCKHSIATDYFEYINTLDKSHDAYISIPINNWTDLAWIGFYQYIENKIPINTWHYVANPSGGFWNLCLTWNYWDCFPVYSQIEQGKLTFKIALSHEETGKMEGEINFNNVQDFVQEKLLQFADKQNFDILHRPYPYVHRGNYRTIAVIKLKDWIGNTQERVGLDKVVTTLKKINEFHSSLMEHLKEIQFSNVQLSHSLIN